MTEDPFNEYVRQLEPEKQGKSIAWYISIELQKKSGKELSNNLMEVVVKNIEDEITIGEAEKRLKDYYCRKCEVLDKSGVEEADKVCLNMAKVLSEEAFTLSHIEYLGIHKRLFNEVYECVGQTQNCGSLRKLGEELEQCITIERKFNYKGLSIEESISHLASFAAALGGIPVFDQGNTRTTTIFLIKYLKMLGFDEINIDYLKDGSYESVEAAESFLRSLLLGETS